MSDGQDHRLRSRHHESARKVKRSPHAPVRPRCLLQISANSSEILPQVVFLSRRFTRQTDFWEIIPCAKIAPIVTEPHQAKLNKNKQLTASCLAKATPTTQFNAAERIFVGKMSSFCIIIVLHFIIRHRKVNYALPNDK